MKTNSNPISLIQEVQPLIKQIAAAEIKTILKKEITAGVRPANEKEDKKIDEMLTASLRDMGVVNPLIVVKQADGTYRLITGSRRFNSTQEKEVPVRIVNAELSKEVCEILSYLVRMVDTLHSRELSDKESYDAVKNIAEAYQLDDTHSFTPMMSLLGLESQNDKYKNLKRIWELYRHSELRGVIDSGIAEVKHLKTLKLDLGKMDAFAAALKEEHTRWVKAGSLKANEPLDSKTCKDVLSRIQQEERARCPTLTLLSKTIGL